jgi:hypothetical protein
VVEYTLIVQIFEENIKERERERERDLDGGITGATCELRTMM